MTDLELMKLWNECVEVAKQEFRDNVDLSEWELVQNGRLSRALGRTCYAKRRVEMQKNFVKYGTRDEVKDTLLHELAHIIAGGKHHHDSVWRSVALQLGAVPRASKKVSDEVAKHRAVRKKADKYQDVLVNGMKFRVLKEKLPAIIFDFETQGKKIEVLY